MFSISGRHQRAAAILIASVLTVGMAFLYLANPLPPIPQRTLRIGFEENPPLQFHAADGLTGLGVEAVSEAAKRAGVPIQWVEPGATSEEAFRKGLVDLWPVMADLPQRRHFVHFSRPWLHSSHTLLVRSGAPIPDREFAGRIGLFRLPLHVQMARGRFPSAQLVQFPVAAEVLSELCKGMVAAGFLEFRTALGALQAKPAECSTVTIRTQILPDLTNQLAVASTFETAGAADRIRREIGNMFRDGAMAVMMAKYSYYGLDNTWAVYDSMEAAQRARWLAVGVSGLTALLGLIIWRVFSAQQRRRAEAALRESEERFRNMADTAPVMIWVAGTDKVLNFFNKTWLDFVGRTMEQELNNSWTESVHGDDLDRCFAAYSSAFDLRETFHIEARFRRADGEYRWVLCTGVPRFAPDGVFEGYIGSDIDITDLKRAQQKTLARQKLESIGLLAGGIAHDFNNLLGSILTTSEVVLLELPAGSPAIDWVQAIQGVAHRGAGIVRQMMTYAGQENAAFERVDVGQVVGEMIQLLRVSISKRATLRVDAAEHLPAVWANAAQIRQVVMNLVINASEALGEEEGDISVTLARVPSGSGRDHIRLEISDTGCGMTEEIRGKMFDPFFTTKFAGRGLGLASVQGIVLSHGGVLDVSSAPGQGCRMEILLPCASELEPANCHAPLSTGDGATLSGTILVVEDEDTLRHAVTQMLQSRNLSVIEARDGTSALELFRINASRIDVALLDMTLPGLQGREVLGELRRIRPELKVIVTSAYDKDQALSAMGELQPWLYLRKPYQFTELVAVLRKVCSQRQGVAATGLTASLNVTGPLPHIT